LGLQVVSTTGRKRIKAGYGWALDQSCYRTIGIYAGAMFSGELEGS
jgi:hypothetical protein